MDTIRTLMFFSLEANYGQGYKDDMGSIRFMEFPLQGPWAMP